MSKEGMLVRVVVVGAFHPPLRVVKREKALSMTNFLALRHEKGVWQNSENSIERRREIEKGRKPPDQKETM